MRMRSPRRRHAGGSRPDRSRLRKATSTSVGRRPCIAAAVPAPWRRRSPNRTRKSVHRRAPGRIHSSRFQPRGSTHSPAIRRIASTGGELRPLRRDPPLPGRQQSIHRLASARFAPTTRLVPTTTMSAEQRPHHPSEPPRTSPRERRILAVTLPWWSTDLAKRRWRNALRRHEVLAPEATIAHAAPIGIATRPSGLTTLAADPIHACRTVTTRMRGPAIARSLVTASDPHRVPHAPPPAATSRTARQAHPTTEGAKRVVRSSEIGLPSLLARFVGPSPPVLLVQDVAGRTLICRACSTACRHGIRPGLDLAEARMLLESGSARGDASSDAGMDRSVGGAAHRGGGETRLGGGEVRHDARPGRRDGCGVRRDWGLASPQRASPDARERPPRDMRAESCNAPDRSSSQHATKRAAAASPHGVRDGRPV